MKNRSAKFFRALLTFRRKTMSMGLLTWLAGGNHYKACAFLFGRMIRRVPTPGGEAAGAKYNIMVLQKGGLNQDVFDSLKDGPFQIFEARRTDLHALFAAFLPENIRDYSYLSPDPEMQKGKLAYREFLRNFWIELCRSKPFHAVMTGNVVYYAERELSAALEGLDVPFIALHKECLKNPGAAEYFTHNYRMGVGPFMGRRVFVYNEVERRNQLESGINTPDRIKVVGMPRMDRYHIWRRQGNHQPSGPNVLILWFTPKTGLFRLASKDSGKTDWSNMMRGTGDAVLKLARQSPDLKITVKSKGMPGGTATLQKQVCGDQPLPKNVELMCGDDPYELILETSAVCGFNSSSVLEAIAADKPVVTPRFAEALDPAMQPYILNMEDAVDYANSPDDLTAWLERMARSRPVPSAELSPARVRMLDKWFGNSDGKAGERVCAALLEELQKRQPQMTTPAA